MLNRTIHWRRLARLIFLTGLICSTGLVFIPATSAAQTNSSPLLIQYEAQLVYLTNLKRQEQGIPPLRWNRELSLAARDFSRDAVLKHDAGFCGHTDTAGRGPGERFRQRGYAKNMSAWGENVVCGLVTPEAAITGWTNSKQHRKQLLDPNFREIGIGYFQDPDSGLGYVTQDFSTDPMYAPVIINREAVSTASTEVMLYIYRPESTAGFQSFDSTTEMMVSNSPAFIGATWEPYSTDKTWTLDDGEGWRTVYVKLRDGAGRTVTATDTIYLGSEPAFDELSLSHASRVHSTLTFAEPRSQEWSHVQFRLNWIADNEDESFVVREGESIDILDEDAIGGTAVRLSSGKNGIAELSTYRFLKDQPLEAFFRLRVSDNQFAGDAASLTINGGGVTYGPIVIQATDFQSTDSFQAFVLPFVFHADSDNPFLYITVRSFGNVDVDFDAVTFFTQPEPLASPLQWHVPDNYFRGQGVWARFQADTGRISRPLEMAPLDDDEEDESTGPLLFLQQPADELHFEAHDEIVSPAAFDIGIECVDCTTAQLEVECDVDWLLMELSENGLTIRVDVAALEAESYTGTIRISAPDDPNITPVSFTVEVTVRPESEQGIDRKNPGPADLDFDVYLPFAVKDG